MNQHRKMLAQERFMVVAFTEHQAARQYYGRAPWPQHMTIIPWVERWRAQATTRLTDAMANFGPVHADVVAEAKFGANHDVPAWTLGPCDILQRLHRQVRGAVVAYGTQWAPDVDSELPYRPHVTIKPGQPQHEIGDRLTFSELSVIGYHEVLGKMVFANVNLGGGQAVA